MAPSKPSSPVLVVGVGGSFAESLATALGAHPELQIADVRGVLAGVLRLLSSEPASPEHLSGALASFSERLAARDGAAGVPTATRLKPGDSVEALRAAAQAEITAVLEELATANGASTCVLLADDCVEFLSMLGELFPESLCLQVLRDPREIALEALSAASAGDAASAGERWLTEVATMLARENDHPDRTIRVISERLAESPAGEVARLCRAIGVSDDPAETSPVAESLAELRDRPQRWPASLDVRALESIEAAVQPTLTLLGYAPAAAARSFESLRRDAGRVEELTAQVAALEQQVSERDSLVEEIALLRQQVDQLTAAGSEPPAAPPEAVPANAAGGVENRQPNDTADANDALVAENARLRLRARRYDELQSELQSLRFKASQYDSLVGELGALRFKAAGYEEIAQEMQRLRFRADEYEKLTEEAKRLRFKAGEQGNAAEEVQRLRFRAREYDKLAQEVRSLRFKAGRYDEIVAENLQLRYKARRYDKLRRWLAPIRPLVRLFLRRRAD